MKLSNKVVYKRCYELWNWLSKNPDKDKKDWVDWEINGDKYKRVAYDCFVCEQAKNMCQNCLLIPLWINKNAQAESGFIYCTLFTSPYLKYIESNCYEDRSMFAKIIADYCKNKLKGLYNE